jgi:hypothetical protein
MSSIDQIKEIVDVVKGDMKGLEQFPSPLRHTMFLAQNLHLITALEVAAKVFCNDVDTKGESEAAQIKKRYETETLQLSIREYFTLYKKYLHELTLFVNNVSREDDIQDNLPDPLSFFSEILNLNSK